LDLNPSMEAVTRRLRKTPEHRVVPQFEIAPPVYARFVVTGGVASGSTVVRSTSSISTTRGWPPSLPEGEDFGFMQSRSR
jgi:hypothetical protein